jgi:hypothetical protein
MGNIEAAPGGWASLETARLLDNDGEARWPIPEVDFDKQACVMLLHLRDLALISRLIDETTLEQLIEQGVRPKHELHITAISLTASKHIKRAMAPYSEDDKRLFMGHIDEVVNNTDWSWQPTGRLYPFRRPEQTGSPLKVVEMIDLPSLGPFYEYLNQLLPTAQLTPPPAHITLLKKRRSSPNVSERFQLDGLATGIPLTNLNDPPR